MTTMGARVAKRRKELGMSQAELAKQAGLRQPTISSLERNGSKTSGHCASLAAALGVSPIWLETGEGAPFLPEGGQVDVAQYAIPIVGTTRSASADALSTTHHFLRVRPEWFDKRGAVPALVFAVYVEDESMSPFIGMHDVALFMPDRNPVSGAIYAIETADGWRIRRVLVQADDSIVLCCDGPDKTRYINEHYSRSAAMALPIRGRLISRSGPEHYHQDLERAAAAA